MPQVLLQGLANPQSLVVQGYAPGAAGLDLNEAIVAYVGGRPDLRATTSDGKLWEIEAPQEPTTRLPYATFLIVSDVAECIVAGGAFRMHRASLQVSLHHWTSKRAKDLARIWAPVLKMAPLIVQGTPVMHCLPDGQVAAIGEGLGDGGKDCHIEMLTYDILYTRSD